MQSYQNLEIYDLSHKLAVEIHEMTLKRLPRFEVYEGGSQVRRSSKSIPALIVEGFGRKKYKLEYVKYLTYALASVDETKEHLQLLFDTSSLKQRELFESLFNRYENLGKKLHCFRQAVLKSLESATWNLQPVT